MSEVKVTMGFVLRCRICAEEVTVGHTQVFSEQPSGQERTAYFDPEAGPGDRPIGYSSGSGDSFACKMCHVSEWAALRASEGGATP